MNLNTKLEMKETSGKAKNQGVTGKQRWEFVKEHAWLDVDTLAREMKKAGLYSINTVLIDIRSSIRKMRDRGGPITR